MVLVGFPGLLHQVSFAMNGRWETAPNHLQGQPEEQEAPPLLTFVAYADLSSVMSSCASPSPNPPSASALLFIRDLGAGEGPWALPGAATLPHGHLPQLVLVRAGSEHVEAFRQPIPGVGVVGVGRKVPGGPIEVLEFGQGLTIREEEMSVPSLIKVVHDAAQLRFVTSPQ